MSIKYLDIYSYKVIRILLVFLLTITIYYIINIGNLYIDKDKRINVRLDYVLPTIGILFFILVLYGLFKRYSILSDTFFTILVSIILAYLLNPIINFLESKGFTRLVSVLLLYIFILLGILIFAFLILPRTGQEIKKFIYNSPIYINKFSKLIDRWIENYDLVLKDLPILSNNIKVAIKENIAGAENIFLNGLKGFLTSIINIFAKVVSLVLTPILTLYFLVDKDYFINKFISLIPKDKCKDISVLFEEIDNSLSMFVRGRLIMALYVGVSVSIILLIFRVDFALAIGFITGFADIIPYIGPFLGFVPAVFFALIESPSKAFWVAVLFLIVQWTENNILAPKVIGDTTGLHPMIILLSIVVGGGMFGVLGMIFAVPTVSIAIILYKHFRNQDR